MGNVHISEVNSFSTGPAISYQICMCPLQWHSGTREMLSTVPNGKLLVLFPVLLFLDFS